MINVASIRPKGNHNNKKCNETCRRKYLDSVFDD